LGVLALWLGQNVAANLRFGTGDGVADHPLETQLAIEQARPSYTSYDLTSVQYLYLEAHALLDPLSQEKNVSSKVRL
jgi:hypothetical protein